MRLFCKKQCATTIEVRPKTTETQLSQLSGNETPPKTEIQHQKHTPEEKKAIDQRCKRAVVTVLLTAILCFACLKWLIHSNRSSSVLIPDVAPEQLEKYAELIDPNIPEGQAETATPSGDHNASIFYSDEFFLFPEESFLHVLIADPASSQQDIVVQILVQDTLLARSDLLEPGYQMQKIDLLPGVLEKLSPGRYNAVLNIFYYDHTTKEKTDMNVKIDASLIVFEAAETNS